MDVVETIRSFNRGREGERLAMKYANMRANAFVFLRGTCHLFYERLAPIELPAGAPMAWLCGDLHLENFGSYKGDNRLVYFDINDFDESALGPATWDLVRLLSSVQVAAETLHINAREAMALGQDIVAGYGQALESGKARWIERDTATGLIGGLLEELRDRKRARFIARRLEADSKGKPVIRCDGRHALKADGPARKRVAALMQAFASQQANPRFFDVLDVARRIAGTGSLGVERFTVLVRGKGSAAGRHLLDLKEALPPSLPRARAVQEPPWPSEARRIVAAQSRMQAVSAAFLHPIDDGARSYVLRGLQPSEDRVSLETAGTKLAQIRGVLQDMGRLLAWAELRSSGRQGAAPADALIAFGASRPGWERMLLDAARRLAEQTVLDWKTYAKAYDKGAFRT